MSLTRHYNLWLLVSLFSLSIAVASPVKIGLVEPAIIHANLAQWHIVDARTDSAFKQGHIPTSQWISWEDWTYLRGRFASVFVSPSRWGVLRDDVKRIQTQLAQLGLSHERKVVVVGDPKGWGEEGRIAWMLLYFGFQQVFLLDGGISAWQSQGFELDTGPSKLRRLPAKAPAQLPIVSFDQQRRITTGELYSILENKLQLYDVREQDEFVGKVTIRGQKRPGHIAGAKLIPFRSLYQNSGAYIDKVEFIKLVGNPPQDVSQRAPVAYCTGGIRSALFSMLYEIYIGQKVRNYEASIWAWAEDRKLPMVLMQ